MKKIINFLIVLFFITSCSKGAEGVSTQILKDPITKITVEDLSGPKTIEFTYEEGVNSVIELLMLDEWVKLKKWNIKLAPNLYVVINGDIVIGLFKGDNFAKIEGSNGGYYEIPKDVNLELSRLLETFD